MQSSLTRKIRLFTSAAAFPALCFGAGCVAGEDTINEESTAAEESQLLSIVGYSGYLNSRDLNHDGAPDLVVINVVGNTVAVRLNNGDGTFGPVTRYFPGITPTFIAINDCNADHDLDVSIVTAVTNSVAVFEGNPDGTLQPPQSFSVQDPLAGQLAVAPFGIVAEDFDGNGTVDMATSNIATNNISFLPGNGDCTFQAPTTYPLLGPSSVGGVPFPLATTDFDGDGHRDLISGAVNGIVFLRGHGDGSFTAISTYHTGVATTCIELDDLNHDGHDDIITTALGSSNYTTLMNDGYGNFTVGESKNAGGIAAECFGLGDLNGDNEIDLAVANTHSLLGACDLAVMFGHGDGTFSSPDCYPVGTTPWAASIVDYNGDNLMDIGVVNGTNTSVSIMFGDGRGDLSPQTMYPM
jgi:hypothetical protein